MARFAFFSTTGISILCTLSLLLSISNAWSASGDTDPKIPISIDDSGPINYHLYGGTFSAHWQGFPPILAPDYDDQGPFDRLIGRYPVFIDWEMHVTVGTCSGGGPCPEGVPLSVPPRPLASEPWFVTNHNDFLTFVVQKLTDDEYHTCAEGDGLESPLPQSTNALQADGTIQVADTHGGIGDETLFYSVRVVLDAGNRVRDVYILSIRWDKVQSYTDIVTDVVVDAFPGTTVRRPTPVEITQAPGGGCQAMCQYDIVNTVLAVQWPSTDVAGSSVRYVDAGDLAALANELPSDGDPPTTVRWGFDSAGGQSTRNYHVNVAPFGSSALFIDQSDLSALADDLSKSCGLNKASGEVASILDWFGIEATGGTIVIDPAGTTIPEYRIVDWEKASNAIEDPYGYQNQTSAAVTRSEWSKVKRLYR